MKRVFDFLLRLLGAFFLLVLITAAVGLPWKIYRWLGKDLSSYEGAPDVIVMMGGGGIPSESGLMRSWQTAREAMRFPRARIVVAHPFEIGENEQNPNPVVKELILRGVSEKRILREGRGRHTREQAVQIRQMFDGSHDRLRLLIVTSPEHMRRSILAFKKAGFPHVRGRSVEPKAVEANLEYSPPDSAPTAPLGKAVGHSLTLRYQFWDNLGLSVRVTRELVALAYYKLNGWI